MCKAIFDIMGRVSKVVVSDEEAGLASALLHLKDINEFDGTHCLDLFHVLRNVRAKLSLKENLKYFPALSYQNERSWNSKIKQRRDECVLLANRQKDPQDI